MQPPINAERRKARKIIICFTYLRKGEAMYSKAKRLEVKGMVTGDFNGERSYKEKEREEKKRKRVDKVNNSKYKSECA